MNNKALAYGLCIAAFIVYIIGLFPEVGIDAGKYAAVSRIMYESGDWLNPQIHNHFYLQKPHLLFWLSSISFHIFGVSLFAFKLPTLLFSLASMFALYKMTRLYYNKQTGLLAAFIYATSEMMFLYHNDLHTDALFTANLVIGVSFLAHFIEKKKALHFILGFVFVGLSMITKGFIGLALAGVAIAGQVLLKKNWKMAFNPVWLLGLPVLAIVLFPTLKSYYNHFGWEGLEFYFWGNNAGRLSGAYNKGGSVDGDMSFYLHTMIYIYLPWSLMAFIAFGQHIRNIIVNKGIARFKRPEYLSYSVILIYTFVLSVARQKAPHYFYPVTPFISMVLAYFIYQQVNDKANLKIQKWLLGARNVMLVIVWAVIALIVTFIFRTNKIYIWIPVIAGLVMTILFLQPKKEILHKLIVPLAVSSIVINFLLNAHFIPTAFQYHGGVQASRAYTAQAKENEDLYTYRFKQFETYFYPSKISHWVGGKDDINKIVDNNDIWVVTTEDGLEEIKAAVPQRIISEQVFSHRLISRFSGEFLNPATRAKTLDKVYLVKIK